MVPHSLVYWRVRGLARFSQTSGLTIGPQISLVQVAGLLKTQFTKKTETEEEFIDYVDYNK